MSGGFSNPIIGGGGNLVYPSIRSPNFSQAGQTGWAILRNGNAFFFQLELAGGSLIVEASGGVFVYSGVAGPGNPPVASMTNSSADPFGNAVTPVIAAYGPGGKKTYLVAGSQPGIVFDTGGASNKFVAEVYAYALPSNQEILVISGSVVQNPYNDQVYMLLQSSPPGGPVSALAALEYQNTAGTPFAMIEWGSAGVTINYVNTLVAQDPSNFLVNETWHAISLASGWSAVTGTPSYRLLPDGNVQINARLSHASFSSNIAIAGTPLPAAYRPLNNQYMPAFNSGNSALQIGTDGSLTALTGSAVTGCVFNGTYPLNI